MFRPHQVTGRLLQFEGNKIGYTCYSSNIPVDPHRISAGFSHTASRLCQYTDEAHKGLKLAELQNLIDDSCPRYMFILVEDLCIYIIYYMLIIVL